MAFALNVSADSDDDLFGFGSFQEVFVTPEDAAKAEQKLPADTPAAPTREETLDALSARLRFFADSSGVAEAIPDHAVETAVVADFVALGRGRAWVAGNALVWDGAILVDATENAQARSRLLFATADMRSARVKTLASEPPYIIFTINGDNLGLQFVNAEAGDASDAQDLWNELVDVLPPEATAEVSSAPGNENTAPTTPTPGLKANLSSPVTATASESAGTPPSGSRAIAKIRALGLLAKLREKRAAATSSPSSSAGDVLADITTNVVGFASGSPSLPPATQLETRDRLESGLTGNSDANRTTAQTGSMANAGDHDRDHDAHASESPNPSQDAFPTTVEYCLNRYLTPAERATPPGGSPAIGATGGLSERAAVSVGLHVFSGTTEEALAAEFAGAVESAANARAAAIAEAEAAYQTKYAALIRRYHTELELIGATIPAGNDGADGSSTGEVAASGDGAGNTSPEASSEPAECVVCYGGVQDTQLGSCEHRLCGTCANHLLGTTRLCPWCRASFDSVTAVDSLQ